MSRPPSRRVVPPTPGLRDRLQARKAEQPCWGDRRIWASRRLVEQLQVTKQRSLRLRREPPRLVPPPQRLQAKRPPTRSPPKPTRPHAGWGLDLTKVLVPDVGWVCSVVVRDGDTKTRVGSQADLRATAQPGLAALDRAVHRQCPPGVRGPRLRLLRANGGQPRAGACMQAGSTLGMQQTFTSDNKPQGQADTERMMRTLNEEGLWLHEWTCPCI